MSIYITTLILMLVLIGILIRQNNRLRAIEKAHEEQRMRMHLLKRWCGSEFPILVATTDWVDGSESISIDYLRDFLRLEYPKGRL